MSVVIKFPIVVYPSEYDDAKAFTAHCLNMDLVADDATIEGAVSKLLETIEAAFDASEKHSTWPFADAPPEYWKELNGAKSFLVELSL